MTRRGVVLGAAVLVVAGIVFLVRRSAAAAVLRPGSCRGVLLAKPTGRRWPVVTTDPSRYVVHGGTRFCASREGGRRIHAGVDLVARPGDAIVATEDGVVLGYASGYEIGAGLQALVIEHSSGVAVYAELRLSEGLHAGMRVRAGQRIATAAKNADGNTMLHFELWRKGYAPSAFTPWYSKRPAPYGLLDPSEYLMALASRRM